MRRFLNLKDLGVAFSLASIWFIATWRSLIFPAHAMYYFSEINNGFAYLVLLIDVLFLGFIFLFLIKLPCLFSNVWLQRFFKIVFLMAAAGAFGGLSSEFFKWYSPDTVNYVNFPLPLIVLLLCIVFAAGRNFSLDAIISNLKSAALLLLPFIFLLGLQLSWVWVKADSALFLPEKIEAGVPSGHASKTSKKIVWVIFDELDYATLMTAKKNNVVNLPDVERLMNESLVAENSFSPAPNTLESVLSLLTGKLLADVEPSAPNNAVLYPLDNSQSFFIRGSDNILSEMKNSGATIGVVGWNHPYPRLFGENLSYGYWMSEHAPQCNGWTALPVCAAQNFIASLQNIPLMTRMFPALWTLDLRHRINQNHQIDRHRFLLGKAKELSENHKLDFLFFHFSVPHFPYIGLYPSEKETYFLAGRSDLNSGESYFNGLEVVNDTVRQLRETLEKSGQWDDTLLIVSSDHPWRDKTAEDFQYLPEEERENVADDLRIPFIIKFPKQKTRLDYQPPVNTIITRQFASAIFRNEISTEKDFIDWLEHLRRAQPDLVNFRPSAK